MQGRDQAKSSCYAESMGYYKKNKNTDPDLCFALLSGLPSKKPHHMIVLDKHAKKVVFDSLESKRLSKAYNAAMVYKPHGVPETLITIHVGKFKDLEK